MPQNITYAAGSFASASDKPCPFMGGAMTYHYILRWAVDTQPVCVSARFQADIVVVAIYHTVLYQYIRGGVDVYPVRTRASSVNIIVNLESVDTAIVGIKNLASPETCTH